MRVPRAFLSAAAERRQNLSNNWGVAQWHGAKVPPNEDYAGPVVFIALEGGTGINNRIQAMRKERGYLFEFEDGFFLLTCALDLCGSNDGEALCQALVKLTSNPGLIVIDTLARSMGDGDENTAKDMGKFVGNLDFLRAETGAHVMVIHHSGKDESKGAGGSGSLRAGG